MKKVAMKNYKREGWPSPEKQRPTGRAIFKKKLGENLEKCTLVN